MQCEELLRADVYVGFPEIMEGGRGIQELGCLDWILKCCWVGGRA